MQWHYGKHQDYSFLAEGNEGDTAHVEDFDNRTIYFLTMKKVDVLSGGSRILDIESFQTSYDDAQEAFVTRSILSQHVFLRGKVKPFLTPHIQEDYAEEEFKVTPSRYAKWRLAQESCDNLNLRMNASSL